MKILFSFGGFYDINLIQNILPHSASSTSSECGCAVFPSSNTSLFPESCHAWNIRMGDPKSTPKHTSNASRIFMTTTTYLYIFLLIHLLLSIIMVK